MRKKLPRETIVDTMIFIMQKLVHLEMELWVRELL